MTNKRFATSMHILTLLAKSDGEYIRSEYIAGSININPVTVRKELSNLAKHGLIVSKEGKSGGVMLAKHMDEINLSDVYRSVRPASVLGFSSNDPNPRCPVGRHINCELERILLSAEDRLLAYLGNVSLADFVANFKHSVGGNCEKSN